MKSMTETFENPNLIVITGAPGTGKSTLIEHLKNLGATTVQEPARELIEEQRTIGGSGLWDKDSMLFNELLLSRKIFLYKSLANSSSSVFFDRGIVDTLAYSNLAGIPNSHMKNASLLYRYHTKVFFLPPWEEIFENDEERTLSFEQTCHFSELLNDAYLQAGYELLSVLPGTIEERSKFILDELALTAADFQK